MLGVQFSGNRAPYALFFFAAIILVVGGINYATMLWSQDRIMQHEALRVAEVVTHQALSSRSVYATAVADKLRQDGFGASESYHGLKGFVPIPAQYLRYVAEEVRNTNAGVYSYQPLSKWNLAPDQGLADEFQRWAWQQLELQDQAEPGGPIAWQPVWQFAGVDGVRTLRYISADGANAANCIECHSIHERRTDIVERRLAQGVEPGKQWRLYQLMGALEVNIPMDRIEALAASQANLTLATVLSTSLGGMLAAAVLGWRNIRRERAKSDYFEQQARFDPLTRLLNRAGLEELSAGLVQKARTFTAGITVLFVDLNGFKPVNDTYGHRVGDELLKQVAARLRGTVRRSDIVARLGGDEFLIVMEDGCDESQSRDCAQQLLDAIGKSFVVDGHEIRISASIGLSCYPQHGRSLKELVQHADQAMYQAKAQRRGGFVVYSGKSS